MASSMVREIRDELRRLVDGRPGIVDGIVAPVVFVLANSIVGMPGAAYAGIAVAVVMVAARLLRRHELTYAMSGLVGTGLAIGLALRSGDAQDYFLPGIVTGAATTVVALFSVLARRPLVAYSSWLVRRWPLEWYWHPRVRPAYTAATWLWSVFFGARTAVQGWLYATEQTTALGFVRAATGWPGIALLLVLTLVIGRTRLVALGGPSVEQFREDAPPSEWTPQPSGF